MLLLDFEKKAAYLQCCFLTYRVFSMVSNTWNPNVQFDLNGQGEK